MSAAREKEHGEANNDQAWKTGGSKPDAGAAPLLQPVDEPREMNESNISPPSGYDIDQLNHHIGLQEFGRGLQIAANAVFSNTGNRRSRYTKVGKTPLDPTSDSGLLMSALNSKCEIGNEIILNHITHSPIGFGDPAVLGG
jgi:hypothetical protein